jgi:AAA+ superfamily predicted ATPase
MSKSQAIAADLAALFRARNPLIWIASREEARVEKYIFEAAASAGYLARTWDIAAGFAAIDGSQIPGLPDTFGDPDGAMTVIGERSGERGVWIMRDLPALVAPPAGSPLTLRRLRNLARNLPGKGRADAQAIVIISPTASVPAELANHATVINWPLPDREEIEALLDATIESLPEELQETAVNGSRDAIVDAAVGLSGEEAQATFASSLVKTRRIEPAAVASEKERAISKGGVLEFVKPLAGGVKAVGGLDNFLSWLIRLSVAWTPEARAYGLQAPKGAMAVGVPGCGKSLTAKAIAGEWQVPLIKLDLGALRSKYVGESESNLRQALSQIEAVGRCVVWLDEVEKALAGATGEQGDGGVAADALGAILSWMQDREGEAFVFATANNAEKLPPELLRKGRFDEIWWVDLPNHVERQGVMAAALRSHGRDAKAIGVDLARVADATDTFTGAEIAALVPDAMFSAFADNKREVNTDDLLEAAKTVVPLAKTSEAKIRAIRETWTGKARNASAPAAAPKVKAGKASRELDF